MKRRYIILLISALALMVAPFTVTAQIPLPKSIKTAPKASKSMKKPCKSRKPSAKPDTTRTNGSVLGYMDRLPSHKVQPETIAPALVGIQQTFRVRDNEGNEYTRNGNDYFSLVPGICFETSMGTLMSGNVMQPWRTDSAFMPHQGPYSAFLYEKPRTVTLFGQLSGKNFEQLDNTSYLKPFGNPHWDLWLYDNGYGAPADRRLEIDTTGGDKTGTIVWMVMPEGNSSPDSIRLISVDHKVSLATPEDQRDLPAAPALSPGEIVIGGCFLISAAGNPVPYRLAGIASLKDGIWYMYYPFATLHTRNPAKQDLPHQLNISTEESTGGDTTPQTDLSQQQKQGQNIGSSTESAKEEELEQFQQHTQAKSQTKADCGCQGSPCEKHASSGLDPDCSKCRITDSCARHNKKLKIPKK